MLSESGMKNHPITPMTDANLMRLMDAQAKGKTGLVAYADVIKGASRGARVLCGIKSTRLPLCGC
ncbi:4-hydroxy-3-methylbut-2-enyl diphosphate reductase [Haemophilus influenzae]|uniref:4-hydroxy-3-methylbut-2-enyl diphosphate reductase n=1 Tax=Haemophilus influenzae TaxID=727 RepID=A0A2X1PMW0_HAEIF|nr:4-hydroxy-3-methylbut-2-enyl diphosphate reductase [Haemophilus influenzae]